MLTLGQKLLQKLFFSINHKVSNKSEENFELLHIKIFDMALNKEVRKFSHLRKNFSSYEEIEILLLSYIELEEF